MNENNMNEDFIEMMDWEYENLPDDDSFDVDDDSKADWVIRKIHEIEAEGERLNAVRKERIETLKRAIERENERTANATTYWRSLLECYFNTRDAKETKTQFSYTLPSGKLIRKKASRDFKPDPDKLRDWLTVNHLTDYLKTEVSPRWAQVKAQLVIADDGSVIFSETGEIVPDGTVTVETKPERFEVKAASPRKE